MKVVLAFLTILLAGCASKPAKLDPEYKVFKVTSDGSCQVKDTETSVGLLNVLPTTRKVDGGGDLKP